MGFFDDILNFFMPPDGKIEVEADGNVNVTGKLARYRLKIANFMSGLGTRNFDVVLRDGRFKFSGNLPKGVQQRIRNFLVNECRVKLD